METTKEYSFDSVLQMFLEIGKQFKETREEFKEIQAEMRRLSAETDKQFKETDRRFKETDKQFKETDKQIEETSKEVKKTTKNINRIAGEASSRWGKLIEAIVKPACLKLFRERNIDVTHTYQNIEIKRGDTEAEFDIILANGTEVVITEVKTELTVKKVNHFLDNLSRIKSYFPNYADKTVYGCVAAIKYNEQSDKYAYRKGLFVLRNSGDYILEIANPENFTPVAFGN